jgi:DnaJ-class molecular chaperone
MGADTILVCRPPSLARAGRQTVASRNYYVVLGVASSETEQGVRAAFRDLAKRYHPDRVGPAGAGPFREVAEAYEVLGDPGRRRQYDESLRQERPHAPPTRLVRDVSMRHDLVDVRPSEEAMFDRFERNFTREAVPKGERVDELSVEVAVSPEEAGKGARLRIGVPVFARCARCGGRGCTDCDGAGSVEGERPVAVHLPPMSGKGTTFVLALDGFGIHNFYLRVRVRVDRSTEPQGGW